GDIARALATKAAMSSELDARPSGSEPGLREGTSLWEFGLVGSPAMRARWIGCTLYVGREFGAVNARASALTRDDRGVVSSASAVREGLGGFFLLRSVERHRAGLGNDLGRCLQRVDRRNPGVGRVEELVEHALDRGLRRIRTGVARVVMLVARADHGDAGYLPLLPVRDVVRVKAALVVLGRGRKPCDVAVRR